MIAKILNNIRVLAIQGQRRIFKDWNLQFLCCAVRLGLVPRRLDGSSLLAATAYMQVAV